MTVQFNPRLHRAARIRAVTLAAGLIALALGLLLRSTPLGAIGGLIVLAACGLYVREVRLTGPPFARYSTRMGR